MRATCKRLLLLLVIASGAAYGAENKKIPPGDLGSSRLIDRHTLVTRHNVTINKPDPLAPLSLGNGEFAFTADITGLQTFPGYHQQGIALCTQSQWGWDYPALAMTAARLGRPERAIDALFIVSEKNRFLANGHNFQSSRLPLYLPGNGALLSAVAMMAAGWDGCADRPSPGFPDNGKWLLRWEGLKRMP